MTESPYPTAGPPEGVEKLCSMRTPPLSAGRKVTTWFRCQRKTDNADTLRNHLRKVFPAGARDNCPGSQYLPGRSPEVHQRPMAAASVISASQRCSCPLFLDNHDSRPMTCSCANADLQPWRSCYFAGFPEHPDLRFRSPRGFSHGVAGPADRGFYT